MIKKTNKIEIHEIENLELRRINVVEDAVTNTRIEKVTRLCPKCGSEMGFVRGFPLEAIQDEIVPKADDFVLFDYAHPVCPKCGHEEKLKDGEKG